MSVDTQSELSAGLQSLCDGEESKWSCLDCILTFVLIAVAAWLVIMAASDSMQKKRNNYKLVSDPEIKKNAKKVYRLNGTSYKHNGKDVTGVSSNSVG